jgi:3-dehydroquinate synthase
MNIFLYGPPATGKSTIGQQLAKNLNLPFVDLDRVIEMNAGMSISKIMETQGETAFRDFESAALKEIATRQDKVIALGGGALLREENRAFAAGSGKVILLMAGINTLIQRLQTDSEKRPLLAGDLEAKLSMLLAKRADHYASFPLKLYVDAVTPEQAAHQAQILLGRHRLSAMGEYDVLVGQICDLPCGDIIVTDENVAKFHLEKIRRVTGRDIKPVVIPAGEKHKHLETINLLWKAFLENGLDRKSTVIALGGGVVTDMTGFAASTYMRGINWIAVPTTLLSMVDAALGGKTGFDLPEGKNLIGSFYPPKLVLADPEFLKTLPEPELISGMAEVVKHGIISDPELFELCGRGLNWVKENLAEIVKHGMAVKIKVIEDDPFEKGFRAALNLGHTVGHAVELVSRFNLRHGEAIAIGMVIEAQYAARLGMTNQNVVEKIAAALKSLGLPTQIPVEIPREEIIRAMRVDKKKNAKSIRFALPVGIGKMELVDVTDLENVLEQT